MYKSFVILLLFFLGFYFIYRSNDIEAFVHNQNSNGDEEYKVAENRLRVIEQISKYREDKIKMEFLKLEDDLRQEDEK